MKGKKHINILVWQWGRRGGGPKLAYDIAKALIEHEECSVSLCVSENCEMHDKYLSLNIPVLSIPTYSSKRSLIINSLKLPIIKKRFKEFLLKQQVNIILCPMVHYWNICIDDIFRSLGIKYIFTVNDATNHPGENSRVYEYVLRKEISIADNILTFSNHVKEELERKFQNLQDNKIWMIPLGMHSYSNKIFYRLVPRERRFRLLFFGRIVEYKGLGVLLDAYRILKNIEAPVELIIKGSGDIGPYHNLLRDLKDISLDIRWIDESEIATIFLEADILMNTYIEASQSGVITIAMDMGMPSIVTPIGGLKEQVIDGYTGIITKDVSAESVAEATLKLIYQDGLYEIISRNCSDMAKNELSWNARTAELLNFINNDNLK